MRFKAAVVALFAAVAAAVILVLALSGSAPNHPTTVGVKTVAPPTAQQRCPSGQSFMGCAVGDAAKAVPQGTKPKLKFSVAPAGCKIADVSSWQGHPNWPAAKPFLCGGIYKAGESLHEDPDASYNVHELAALKMWHTAYWFVRSGVSCTAEGEAYVHVLSAFGYTHDELAGPPVLDEETPGIAGYAACMDAVIFRAFHVHAVIYTAPGTWPGGSGAGLLAWPAAYGPSHPPCLPFTCSHYVAWQFAAPPWVMYFVPGLGDQDESVNYTFTSMRPFAHPGPPPLVCNAFAKTMPKGCLKLFDSSHFGQKLTEGQAARDYKYHRHTTANLHAQLHYFALRVWFVAHHRRVHGRWSKLAKPNWSHHRGYRYQRLARDAAGK